MTLFKYVHLTLSSVFFHFASFIFFPPGENGASSSFCLRAQWSEEKKKKKSKNSNACEVGLAECRPAFRRLRPRRLAARPAAGSGPGASLECARSSQRGADSCVLSRWRVPHLQQRHQRACEKLNATCNPTK